MTIPKIHNLRHSNILTFPYSVILFLILIVTSGWSINPSSPDVKKRVLKGIELTILCEFDEARDIYSDFIEDYPEEPIGYFYMAAVLQSQMLDREDFSAKPEFEKLLEKCIQKAKERQNDRKDDPWLLMYEGNACLYRSFMKSKMHDWWGAYRDAGKGADRLEKAIEMDSTLYDAYLGIGSYKYWKSSKMKLLRWLPFVSDEREQGIEMVKKSIELGDNVRLIGKDQLVWILLDAGRLEEAKEYALENYQQYPQSRFFLWTFIAVLYRSEEFDEAYEKYTSLLQMVRQIPSNNHYNEIECLWKMAQIDYQKQNFAKADSLTSEIFDLRLSPEVKERARTKLKEALKLKLKCAKILSENSQASAFQ